jgi:hypothetical protein
MTQRKTTQDKRTFWTHHLLECEKAELAHSKYCRKHGISIKSYYYWKRKLKKNVAVEEAEPLKFVALCHTGNLSPREIPIPVPIRIQIGAFAVEAVPGFNHQNMESILRILEGLSCGK